MIHLDFETFSELDVRRVGPFRYAEHPSTEVLIMCFAFDDGPVHAWTCDGSFATAKAQHIQELMRRVSEGEEVGAHNAMFEYAQWNTVLKRQLAKRSIKVPPLTIKQLNCTAARAAMCSMPRSLENVANVLKLDVRKDKRGAAVMKLFSSARKPTKKDPRTRIYPKDDLANFKVYVDYCKTDVSTEREVDEALPALPTFERRAFMMNFKINERGIPVDVKLIKRAAIIVGKLELAIKAEATSLTDGVRPTQVQKLKAWLSEQGFELENMQATTLKKLLEQEDIDPTVRKLLELRMEAAKVSTKKLISMARVACEDERARGTLLYYGAHTGRESGKLIQPQNFIRGLPEVKDQIKLMKLVFRMLEMNLDDTAFDMVFDNPMSSIAMCMRGFIRAALGRRFLVVDYAQIEARLLVWLADEQSAIHEYIEYDAGRGFDRYVLMAAFLWSIPPEKVSKEQRRIAKNLVLGCGFQLGWRKFIEYCAKAEVIIDEDMSKRAVTAFRAKHPAVVDYWNDVERCAVAAVQKPGQRVHLRNVSFYCEPDGSFLKIRLPSGRDLYYPEPQVNVVEVYGKPKNQLSFKTEFKGHLWVRETTYGGKLVENIVQGIARDIMVCGAINAERHGYPVVLQVHDEMLTEVRNGHGTLQELEQLVCEAGQWLKGCPVKAEGFEVVRYRKG